MGIRRSLRLQSRNGATNEKMKQNVKKPKLPRKRKVKVKNNPKSISGVTPRRSLRIKKRNSHYATDEDRLVHDKLKVQIINNVKIEPCEVKLEQIDMLIEKLNIGGKESKDPKGDQKPVDCEEIKNTVDTPMENEQCEKENDHTQLKQTGDSSEGNITTIGNEEANPTEVDIKETGDETSTEQTERSDEQEERAKKITEMLNQYKIENEIDFDEINSISSNFHEDTAIDTSWGREVSPNCYKEKIINNVLFNNTNVYNFKSCFKDRASLTAAFDRHSGQVSNETYPYDIHETPEAEKVKRFYRKNISDPSLHSWYQYNVASSKRFSKQESEELTSKPYMDRYLLF